MTYYDKNLTPASERTMKTHKSTVENYVLPSKYATDN